MDNTAPEPNNFLNWVDIKNFKSIKDLHLDCKRVNVFIGKPNVGKSNILEGLGLLGAGFDNGKLLKNAVRYQDIRHLFRDNDVGTMIEVVTDKLKASIYPLPTLSAVLEDGKIAKGVANYHVGNKDAKRRIDEFGQSNRATPDNVEIRGKFDDLFRIIKKYEFKNLTEFNNIFPNYLIPPNGYNLYAIVRRNEELWAEFSKLFDEQKLEFVLYDEKQEFVLQKKNGPFVVQYPFFSVADTFRRYMFYITAIESNKNSVIVFEEPEVHSFPPYVKAMAHRMVSSDTNQFFVSTHSPYLLQTLINELDESELAVYITYYHDYQTHVRQLTANELQEAQYLGIDLFYNLSRYEPNA